MVPNENTNSHKIKDPKPKNKAISASISYTATCIFYPLDLFKIRMQDKQIKFIPFIKSIFQKEGVRGMYRGFAWSLMVGNISHYIFFWNLEFFNIVSGNSLNYSKKKQALISYCAGLFSALLVLPLWTLRLRISQISYCKGGNFLQGSKFTILVLRESILQEGFLKLYKGVFSTIIMSLHPMIQMTIYESAKRKYEEEYFRSSLSAQIGCLSRVTATSILYPFNLIKTKQQQIGKLNNQELRENMYTGERDYGRFNHALKSVYSQFGIGGFYRGLTPVVIRNGLQAAFFFYIYEHLNYLQRSKY